MCDTVSHEVVFRQWVNFKCNSTRFKAVSQRLDKCRQDRIRWENWDKTSSTRKIDSSTGGTVLSCSLLSLRHLHHQLCIRTGRCLTMLSSTIDFTALECTYGTVVERRVWTTENSHLSYNLSQQYWLGLFVRFAQIAREVKCTRERKSMEPRPTN